MWNNENDIYLIMSEPIKPLGIFALQVGKNWLYITNCRIINPVWNSFYITPFTLILTSLTIIISYAFVLLLFLEGEWWLKYNLELLRPLSKFRGRTWTAGKGRNEGGSPAVEGSFNNLSDWWKPPVFLWKDVLAPSREEEKQTLEIDRYLPQVASSMLIATPAQVYSSLFK